MRGPVGRFGDITTVMPANQGTSSKLPRFFRHRRRFGDFQPPYAKRPMRLGRMGRL